MRFNPIRFVSRFCRRRPWLSATVFGFVILNLVPTWPYTPTCELGIMNDVNIEEPMSDDYRYSLKAHFKAYGVYYWDIGGIILIRLLPFLDGDESLPQNDGIGNANHKAAWALADEQYIGSFVGRELNGRIYRVPDFIKALRNPKTGEFDGRNAGPYDIHGCRFLRTVIPGKPVIGAPDEQ